MLRPLKHSHFNSQDDIIVSKVHTHFLLIQKINSKKMQVLGEQFLAEYYDCNRTILDDIEKIRSIMLQAANICGATVIDSKLHRFSPYGISGIVMIAESHLSIHTWPEYGYAAFDLFTCNPKLNSVGCLEYLHSELEAKSQLYTKLNRGLNGLESQKNVANSSDIVRK